MGVQVLKNPKKGQSVLWFFKVCKGLVMVNSAKKKASAKRAMFVTEMRDVNY
jgi:hypothetical protein